MVPEVIKLLALLFTMLAGPAFAQCNGVFPANTVCSNLGGSPAAPGPNVLTVPTQSVGTSNTSPASTQFTQQAIANVPLQPPGTNNTTAASTAFVQAAISGGSPATSINGSGPTTGTPIIGGANNTMLTDVHNGTTDYLSAQAPSTFWNTFCGNTIGYVWARMTGGWACGPGYMPPVTWWGAVCDGTTNDAAAISAAVSSGVTGVRITGICALASGITLPANFALSGTNRYHDQLKFTATSGNMVSANNNDLIHDLGFTATSPRPNSGSLLMLSGVTNITLRSLFFTNFYDGIDIDGVGSPAGTCPTPPGAVPCSGLHGLDLEMYGSPSPTASNTCLHFFGQSGTTQPWNTDISISHVFCSGSWAGGIVDGILIETGGDISFWHPQVIWAQTGIAVIASGSTSTGNQVQRLNFTDGYVDSSTNNGVVINSNNNSQVLSTSWKGMWVFSTTAGNKWDFVIDTDATGQVFNTQVSNAMVGNANYGFVIGNNNFGRVINTQLSNNYISTSVSGVLFGIGINTQSLIGNYITGSSCSIQFAATSSFAGQGINIIGNSLAGSFCVGGGLPITGMIADNTGYHSGQPSTASACGSAAISGNDYSGLVTGVPNNCGIVFANAWQVAPHCVWQDLTSTRAGMGTSIATNALNIGGLTPGDNITYNCQPDSGN